MHPPRIDAFQVQLIEVARPPNDIAGMAGEIDHMLAGAAAGFHHVTGFSGQEFPQRLPYRPMVAVKRRRVETTVRLDRPAVLAEFHRIFSHVRSTLDPERRTTSDRHNKSA